jgi:hypothetical protein
MVPASAPGLTTKVRLRRTAIGRGGVGAAGRSLAPVVVSRR